MHARRLRFEHTLTNLQRRPLTERAPPRRAPPRLHAVAIPEDLAAEDAGDAVTAVWERRHVPRAAPHLHHVQVPPRARHRVGACLVCRIHQCQDAALCELIPQQADGGGDTLRRERRERVCRDHQVKLARRSRTLAQRAAALLSVRVVCSLVIRSLPLWHLLLVVCAGHVGKPPDRWPSGSRRITQLHSSRTHDRIWLHSGALELSCRDGAIALSSLPDGMSSPGPRAKISAKVEHATGAE